MDRFRDRMEAGEKLAAALMEYSHANPIVLALPRGGVPVGYQVARALRAPLDVWVVRKISAPWQPEFGLGAVAEGGFVYLAHDVLAEMGVRQEDLAATIDEKRREVAERVLKFRGSNLSPDLRGRTVILVDDGIATGGTTRAALASIRAQGPEQLVLAVPVAPPETIEALGKEVDRFVCLLAPKSLRAIGLWYDDFDQVPDSEVIALLDRAREEHTNDSTRRTASLASVDDLAADEGGSHAAQHH